MDPISYDGRRFRVATTTENGGVGEGTEFAYRQHGDVVWASYEGGGVRRGTLIATADARGVLDMRYAHVDDGGVLMTGVCTSTPQILADGRLRMHERWRWTSGDLSAGESVVEEVRGGV